MVRTLFAIAGIILAIWLVTALIIPALFGLIKVLLVLGIIAFAVVFVITLVGKTSR